MQAIVIKQYGGPEVLVVEDRPTPAVKPGQVLVEVKAFGLNQAEVYFRSGAWGDVAEITGIECVGVVKADPSQRLAPGQKVMALVGGMGRSINGSYAELVSVPHSNVVAIDSDLPWEDLAALPESYATAWSCLHGVLALQKGQTVVVRGASSALGQAAVNIATHTGAHVLATTRNMSRPPMLQALGAGDVLEHQLAMADAVRARVPGGVDAVLDLVGNTTILDSLAMLKRGGTACLAGFLGGGGPLTLEPVFQIPSGARLSVFASALVLGGADFPLSEIPFQTIVDLCAAGVFKAKPAKVFPFAQMQEAHRWLESAQAGGKIVVRL